MSNVRSSNRMRLLIFLVVAVVLASGSYLWLLEVVRHGVGDSSSGAVRTAPDYFVENFNFVRTSKTGQARYAISGVKLTHFPKDDNFQIDLPFVKSLSVDRPSMTMRAQRGFANSDASDVQMFDDVQIDRPVSKFAPHFHLTSEYVEFFPDEDIMRTDKPVVITQGTTVLTGEDMYANNATLMFALGRNVRVVIQPQKH
ncbi:MAG TPA: LPS export ABC transporter periplasmic protein LptC [Burkholderiaceae bacterium]|jgi:lipopolysaccharide export system protein LptC|nr:LPS export ABC transporter periplasmic protein LptC [Burkholderiaceae bacterium]